MDRIFGWLFGAGNVIETTAVIYLWAEPENSKRNQSPTLFLWFWVDKKLSFKLGDRRINATKSCIEDANKVILFLLAFEHFATDI